MKAEIYVTGRIRKSPFFEATLRCGAREFSVYNKTYLPGGYGGPEAEFWSLINDVTLWDVTCQRVVEISGPDAFAFTSILTPRDLSGCKVGQCKYVLITNRDGGILNDPVLLRLAEDCFWLSSADSDILMWARGVAVNAGLEVTIDAPEMATLQLQGPKSAPLLEGLLGSGIWDLKYYHHMAAEIAGIPVILARTGWSAERGYEIYLKDSSRGDELWEALMAAGRAFDIAPASPSRIRRIEAGILDFSVDMDETTNPFEVGLERLVDLEKACGFIGQAALARRAAEGPARQVVGLEIAGTPVAANDVAFPVLKEGRSLGKMTSWVYSPRMEKNIGFAMLPVAAATLGGELEIEAPEGRRAAQVVRRPFIDPGRKLSRGTEEDRPR